MDARIFFCHGSRDEAWRAPFDQLVEDYRQRHPSHPVRLAFLEMMSPTLEQVIGELAAAGANDIDIVPLFLAPGAHTGRDLPAIIATVKKLRPGLRISVSPTVLESDAMRRALIDVIG